MDDYERFEAKKDVLDFFWAVFGPDECKKCGQRFWSDQTKFYRHRRDGGLFARCVHCDTMHRFGLNVA